MKIFKKIILALLSIFILTLIGGHFYFDKKFTPPENYLNVSGNSGNIPVSWSAADGNPHSALLLPVKIEGSEKQFFMQLDFGSPITLFYKDPLQSIQNRFPKTFSPHKKSGQIALRFKLDGLTVSSQSFRFSDYGDTLNLDTPDAVHIIGTIGTDLLEKRIIVLDMKTNTCSFSEKVTETGFIDFEFKKRKILIPAKLENEDLKLLYDSGTSGYQLITNKENWERLRLPEGKIRSDKGNSWGNTLKVISAPANQKIGVGNLKLSLTEVTYIEGTSWIQNLLMQRSGMQGMIGNKLFLGHKLVIDCKNGKFKVE